MRFSEFFEGVVHKGNKITVGSLELQLYPDHIFYVIGGGRDKDLSIYKDGGFKPPRNNEIYLKDAARYGVPQPFVDIFAKFFDTQDMDVVVKGFEALFKKHVKEGEFREPKFGSYIYKKSEFRHNGKLLGLIYDREDGTAETVRQNPKHNNFSRLIKTHKSRKDAENYLISKYNEIINAPEVSEDKDWTSRYRVGCTLIDRNGPSTSQRNKKIFKNVWVRAEDEFDAKKVAQYYYRKKGYSVIDCEITTPAESMREEKQRLDTKCWKGYRKAGTKMKGGVRVNNCVKSGK